MILQVNKDFLSSVAATGGILKSANNGIASYIPSNLFDTTGFLIIKGVGFVSGTSNPGNTTPDVLSIIFSKPNLSSTITQVFFSKIFTNSLSSFEFEIKVAARSAGSGDIYFSVLSQDGTIVEQFVTAGINADTFYEIYFDHSSASGLYAINIDSIITEYKSFGA